MKHDYIARFNQEMTDKYKVRHGCSKILIAAGTSPQSYLRRTVDPVRLNTQS